MIDKTFTPLYTKPAVAYQTDLPIFADKFIYPVLFHSKKEYFDTANAVNRS